MRDIAHCRANRVIVVADQSYGEELVAAADARSFNLDNVIVFTSTEEFNYFSEKDVLTRRLLQHQENDICLNNLKNVSKSTRMVRKLNVR